MPNYKFLGDLEVAGIFHAAGSIVELSEDVAAPFLADRQIEETTEEADGVAV